ncbi:DUF72 domain-containing protein [Pseudomonas sp. NY15372]|uniref:DUF72 domain-containing protein n=1 Tax=Pseudomonas sp. NY15372 TaxID=3400356 RepID=UPI003A8C09F3
MTLFIGCAGWSLSRAYAEAFAQVGSHLQRYAVRLGAVEINSAFYRPHKPQTYARWAASVPDHFRFSVKVPKTITHEQRLHACDALLEAFLEQSGQLGERLGCLLVQLPPSLQYDPHVARRFFEAVRRRYAGQRLAAQLRASCEANVTTWCIFDNTAAGAALGNALALQASLDLVR